MPEEEKKQLRKILEDQGYEMKNRAEDLGLFAADVARKATEFSDAADLIILAAQYGAQDGDWEGAIDATVQANLALRNLDETKGKYYQGMTAVSTSGTASVSISYGLVSDKYIPYMPSDQQSEARKVNLAFSQFFDHYRYRERAIDLMKMFGFGKKMAFQKFNSAWEMFLQNPQATDSSIGALIPLREALQLVVDDLIRRRPTQRRVDRKSKIIEIGDQIRSDSVHPDVFESLNNEFRTIVDEMSGAKDKILKREQQTELMRRGTMFLEGLLNALDPNKLRLL